MVDTWSEGFGRPQSQWEQYIYSDWMQAAQTCAPAELIQRFYRLYIAPDDSHPNPSVREALRQILQDERCLFHFKYILNRTCYILINTWSSTAWHREAIPSLIHQFEKLPPEPQQLGEAVRLHELVEHFKQTTEYKALQALAQMVANQMQELAIASQAPMQTLVYRYPFTYDYLLLPNSSDRLQQQAVRRIQVEAQTQFERDLSQYLTYRQSHHSFRNPTLLSSDHLDQALFQFRGKIYGSYTQRDMASHFRTACGWTRSYREFKQELYHYLTLGLPQYGEGRFLNRLKQRLESTLSRCDGLPLDDSLIEETCHELIYFLIIERSPGYDHFTFLDLVSNIGATLTIALVLKIALLSKRAKRWLEKRFTLLFNHHASRSIADAQWLVESLETFNVGLSTNFPLRNAPV
jgi:hypothetical protein